MDDQELKEPLMERHNSPEKTHREAETPTCAHVLVCTFLFLCTLLTVGYLSSYIPPIDTGKWILDDMNTLGSESFKSFFYRGDTVYNSSFLPCSNLVFYTFANCAGFWYVNISNMNWTRRTLCESAHSPKKDFIYTVLFAPLMFMTSAMLVLRAPQDTSSTEDSEPYSDLNCFLYNQLLWTPAYLLGLQFTHLDHGEMKGFRMTYDEISKQTPFLRGLFILLISFTVSTLAFMTYLYLQAGIEWFYASVLVLTILFFTVPTYLLRETHDLHVHHTNIGMWAALMLGYQHPVITVLHGWANGVMIEGGARWGYDPIWEKKQDNCEKHHPLPENLESI